MVGEPVDRRQRTEREQQGEDCGHGEDGDGRLAPVAHDRDQRQDGCHEADVAGPFGVQRCRVVGEEIAEQAAPRQGKGGGLAPRETARADRVMGELDGGQHSETVAYDNKRSQFLEDLGFSVILATDSERK